MQMEHAEDIRASYGRAQPVFDGPISTRLFENILYDREGGRVFITFKRPAAQGPGLNFYAYTGDHVGEVLELPKRVADNPGYDIGGWVRRNITHAPQGYVEAENVSEILNNTGAQN